MHSGPVPLLKSWLYMEHRSYECGENFHPRDKPCGEQSALPRMVAFNSDHSAPSPLPHIPPAVPTYTLQIHPANPVPGSHPPAYTRNPCPAYPLSARLSRSKGASVYPAQSSHNRSEEIAVYGCLLPSLSLNPPSTKNAPHTVLIY